MYQKHLLWGWTPFLERHYALYLDGLKQPDSVAVGRVISEERGRYRVVLPALDRVGLVQISGGFRHRALSREDYPAVGDWICLGSPQGAEPFSRVDHVLPRQTCLKRKAAGSDRESQILAAQIDEVLVVTSCNDDLNERRLDRALTMVGDSGARARVLLSKADLVDPAALTALMVRIRKRFDGINVNAISISDQASFMALQAVLQSAQTYIVMGSSGVGKSSLINQLIGQAVLDTGGIREDDDKGRHTTVSRSLHRLPGGALIIDTPGIREIQLADDHDGLEQSFDDVAQFAARCRFGDCRHEREPGCAVQAALASGALVAARFESYLKLQRERESSQRRQSKALQSESKRKRVKVTNNSKVRKRFERGDDS